MIAAEKCILKMLYPVPTFTSRNYLMRREYEVNGRRRLEETTPIAGFK
jgi:hypothetical protein